VDMSAPATRPMISTRLARIEQQVSEACHRSGRARDSVKILAVTKTWPPSVVRDAHALGLHRFAENYVQEALPKMSEVKDLAQCEWHFIGNLQSNKVKDIEGRFSLIHSVDRESVLREMEKRLSAVQDVLIEVQMVPEPQKSGLSIQDVPRFLQTLQKVPRVRLRGLMIMPPPGQSRAAFAKAQNLAQIWTSELSAPHSLDELSMGTSDDFVSAIECGATLIRLGTVLFGSRLPHSQGPR
jgi:PLP dependent protein